MIKQVFIKLIKVAPAELEQLLLGHPEVTDSAVIGIDDADAGEVPKAFIVKKNNSQVTAQDLQMYIKGGSA